MDSEYDEATAYHDAGHAVVALALGRQVHQVSILPSRDYLGICAFRKPVVRPSEDWIEREILIALGGVAAESRWSGTLDWGPAERDWKFVHGLAIDRAGERRADRLIQRMLSKTEHLISQDKHWRAIEQIAAALMKDGTISGRAARHFFELSVKE